MQTILRQEQNYATRIAYKFRKGLLRRPSRFLKTGREDSSLHIAGLFGTASGIGQSARACHAALTRHGYPAGAINLSDVFQQSDLHFSSSDLWPPSRAGGTIIMHLNGPETERALFGLGLFRGSKWKVIGYWAWELQILPEAWIPFSTYLDEIWTPSEWVSATVRASVSCPVRTVPHYVALPARVANKESQGFRALIMADGHSSFERKNILGSLNVFEQALSDKDDAYLTIKTRHIERDATVKARLEKAAAKNPRISVLNGTISRQALSDLQQTADVLLSLHRSEGFGLHLAESMAYGTPVIATKWSGNLQFMTENNSILVPAMEIPRQSDLVYGPADGSTWADPDLAFATQQLLRLYETRSAVSTIGQHARNTIERDLNGTQWKSAITRC